MNEEKMVMNMIMMVMMMSVLQLLLQPVEPEPIEPEPEPGDTFILRIANPPSDAYRWTGIFLNSPRIYSSVFQVDQSWSYPGNESSMEEGASPFGRTDLMIRTFDEDLTPTVQGRDLGPLEAGKNYVFDCGTHILAEE